MLKKFFVLMLALAGVQASLRAQQTITYSQSTDGNRADRIFGGKTDGRINFDLRLDKGNKINLAFNALQQIDSLPNINQILSQVWTDLQNFKDSLVKPLVNRKIDYLYGPGDRRIRIQEFPQKGEIYSVTSNEITQLKVEQDTIRIILTTRGTRSITFINPPTNPQQYYITLILNQATDLGSIANNPGIESTIQVLKNDIHSKTQKTRSSYYSRYFAVYDVNQQKRVTPVQDPPFRLQKTKHLEPYAQIAIQYIRGAWAPSVGAGIDLYSKISNQVTNNYRLIWEPYFFFSRNADNKLTFGRNDFVSFKYRTESRLTTQSRTIEFIQNFSVGYLVNRTGSWFEKHTVKFSLPGIQAKTVLLEPEFTFNDLLKHFSPSLKLTLHLE